MVSHSSFPSALVTIYLLTVTEAFVGLTKYCQPNPCKHNGTCHERVEGFVCDCQSEYTGLDCDIVNYCNSSPCLHGGQCYVTKTSYVCDCTGTGFDGFTCHVPHNDCQPNPCLHGGTCTDAFKNFTCQCVTGFAGDKCEVELSACVSSPCINGGTCIDVHAGTNPGQVSPGFQCLCVEGFAGGRCDTNYDDCVGNDCVHGVCVDDINSYTCDCSNSSYYGVHCENKYIDQCSLYHPCQNGATCVQDGDNYHCDCLPFKEGDITYGGQNCSVLLQGCQGVHDCKNDAICIPVLLNEAKNIQNYTCSCNHGFTGDVCDTMTSMTLMNDGYIRKTYIISDQTLRLRFRTSDQNGMLIYDRAGQGFVSVEIVNGSLYLSSGNSTGIIETQQAITSADLSDSHWHSLVLDFSSNTTLTLDDPLCNTTDDCILTVQRSDDGYFKEFFIGQVSVAPWLRQTLSGSGFDGCVQDVNFNTDTLVPNNYGIAEFRKVTMDCPDCLTHTCKGQGVCQPSQTSLFECYCASGLKNGSCLTLEDISCDFESGMCGWAQDRYTFNGWVRRFGPDPSPDTGPSGDHTPGLRGYGHYIYIRGSGSAYTSLRINSPLFSVNGPTCLSLWLYLYGSGIHTFSIYQVWNGYRNLVDYQVGEIGKYWHQHKMTLYNARDTYIQIDGKIGTDKRHSDMAVDDIKLYRGAC